MGRLTAGLGIAVALLLAGAAVCGALWYRQRSLVEVRPEPVWVPRPVVRVTEAELTVDDKRLFGLDSLEAQATRGIDAQFKAQGPNDLVIKPLVTALTQRRAQGTQSTEALTVELAPRTPFRILIEVLFSAERGGATRFSLSMPAAGGHAPNELESEPPRQLGASPASILVYIITDGFSVKFNGRNVAPGCEGHGPGIAVPQRTGYDLAGLVACLKRLNSDPAVAVLDAVITANPGLEVVTLLEVASTLRCGKPRCRGQQLGLPFVQRVTFGVPG